MKSEILTFRPFNCALLLVLSLTTFSGIGQQLFPNLIPDISQINAQQAAQRLVGDNVTISNVTYSGNLLQIGSFDEGLEAVGFDEGIVLTTGNASLAGLTQTSNVSQESPVTFIDTGDDPDLEILNGSGTVFNEIILEFDFVSTSTDLSFKYTFGSDEYQEDMFAFSDAFGFFLSGPGISGGGGFINDAVNLAMVGTDFVSTATVNPFNNASFYFDNPYSNTVGTPLVEGVNEQLVYDGFTWGLSAVYSIQCNETYHIKLAICNTNDPLKDSGIFIEKGGITSPYGPPGPLTIAPVPACEGADLSLTVGGDPNWNYIWSTGQNGVGLQQITTTASTGINTYSVFAEYLTGCSLSVATLPGEVIIHEQNNMPPSCTGGDLYIQAGQTLDVLIPSSDSPDEEVTIAMISGPSGSVLTVPDPSAIHDVGRFVWNPTSSDIGFHTLIVEVTDNNACFTDDDVCTYTIKVVCPYCPICVYYEDRSPGGLPLPDLTVAGHCIIAGEDVDPNQTNGLVSTGVADVEFRAPAISLEPGFTGGPGFLAVPDPNTCVDDCDDCCSDWVGFTVDTPLPNVITPNGDGTNDYWYVQDLDNPYCAFGANDFQLSIFSQWGLVYTLQGNGFCCPFEAPAPGFNIPHSSIFWDGTVNAGTGGFNVGSYVSDAPYLYILQLGSNCGGGTSIDYTGTIQVLGSPGVSGGGGSHSMQGPGGDEVFVVRPEQLSDYSAQTYQGSESDVRLEAVNEDHPLVLWPNPARQELNIQCSQPIKKLEIRDALGRTVYSSKLYQDMFILDISVLNKGSYFLFAEGGDGEIYVEQFIKQ